MLFMVVESFHPGKSGEIYARLAASGRMLPAGVEYVDSWVDPEVTRCFQLMRAPDRGALDPWIEAWSDLADFEVIEVISSREAAERAGS